MVMNLLAVVVIVISAYMWMLRGFFSAMIHLVATVVAGAVAFAVWEPLGLFLLSSAGDRGGFLDEMLIGSSWGFALAFPFIIVYAALRGAIDAALRRNVFVNQAANYVGGGLCGALAGVIVSGICVLSTGFLRLPPDMGMFDYRAVQISAAGAVQRGPALWVPTDRLTSAFYTHLSRNTFYTEDNLATYYPDFAMTSGSSRYAANKGENRARNSIRPGSFKIVDSYTIEPAGAVTGKARLDEMTKDRFTAGQQGVTDIEGKPIDASARLLAYIVEFSPAAREKNGQVVIGNAQITLLATDAEGNSTIFYPNAATLKAQPPSDTTSPAARRREYVTYARFSYNSGGDGIAFPSVGADSAPRFGFEFMVPAAYTPKALYVKGVRADIADPKPARAFTTAMGRDLALNTMFEPIATVGKLDESEVQEVKVGSANASQVVDTAPEKFLFAMSVNIGAQLQRDQLPPGVTLTAGNRGGAVIQECDFKVSPRDLTAFGLDANLRVDKFEAVENQVVCQLDVSMTNEWKLGERGYANDAPIYLIDDKGKRYDAIGFFYRDQDIAGIRYTPGRPLKGLQDLTKALSRSENGQSCKLIFRVSKGVTITGLAVGDKLAIRWLPKFKVDADQVVR